MNVKLTFIPVKARSGRSLEVVRPVRFPANPQLRWSSDLVGRSQHVGAVKVDTDGDRVADTHLPGTSNFVVTMAPPDKSSEKYLCPDAIYIDDQGRTCHCGDRKQHCTEPTIIEG